MGKFLDKIGVGFLWNKIKNKYYDKTYIDSITPVKQIDNTVFKPDNWIRIAESKHHCCSGIISVYKNWELYTNASIQFTYSIIHRDVEQCTLNQIGGNNKVFDKVRIVSDAEKLSFYIEVHIKSDATRDTTLIYTSISNNLNTLLIDPIEEGYIPEGGYSKEFILAEDIKVFKLTDILDSSSESGLNVKPIVDLLKVNPYAICKVVGLGYFMNVRSDADTNIDNFSVALIQNVTNIVGADDVEIDASTYVFNSNNPSVLVNETNGVFNSASLRKRIETLANTVNSIGSTLKVFDVDKDFNHTSDISFEKLDPINEYYSHAENYKKPSLIVGWKYGSIIVERRSDKTYVCTQFIPHGRAMSGEDSGILTNINLLRYKRFIKTIDANASISVYDGNGVQYLLRSKNVTIDDLDPSLKTTLQNTINNSNTFADFLNSTDVSNTAINKWKEIEAFLAGITDTQTLTGVVKDAIDNNNNNVFVLNRTNNVRGNNYFTADNIFYNGILFHNRSDYSKYPFRIAFSDRSTDNTETGVRVLKEVKDANNNTTLTYAKSSGNTNKATIQADGFIIPSGDNSKLLASDGTTRTVFNSEDGIYAINGTYTPNTMIPTFSSLKNWNGAYTTNGTNRLSNLEYCKEGKFGDIITHTEDDYLASDLFGNQGLVNPSTGIPNTNIDWLHSNLISLDTTNPIVTYLNTSTSGDNVGGITFYDKNKNFIKHVHTNTKVLTTIPTTDFPTNAKYFRACSTKYGSVHYYINGNKYSDRDAFLTDLMITHQQVKINYNDLFDDNYLYNFIKYRHKYTECCLSGYDNYLIIPMSVYSTEDTITLIGNTLGKQIIITIPFNRDNSYVPANITIKERDLVYVNERTIK